MKLKKIVLSIISLILVLACSGCSLNFFSVESLLAPPAQSGKNGEVQKAFNELMEGKKIHLRPLSTGEYQSSFVLYDIDSDEEEEAFVFYADSANEGSLRVALMENKKNKWSISADIKGAGNGAYDINFVDLDNDGIFEIFISWALLEGKTTKIISAYEPSENNEGIMELVPLGNEYYNDKTFIDFNGDGMKDAIFVYLDDTGSTPKTYLRSFNLSKKKELLKTGEMFLDGLITSVAKIQSDVVENGDDSFSRIFVDCYKNDKMVFTEMVYWDAKKSAPVRAFKDPSATTLRSSRVMCSDIDNDGLIEVPVITKLYGDESTFKVNLDDGNFVFSMLEWRNVVGDRSEGSVKTVFNPIDMYLLKFNWGSRVTITYDSLRKALLFNKWNEKTKKSQGELFSISYRKRPLSNEIVGEVLLETDEGVYFYDITELGEKFGVTDEGVVSSFIIMK